MTPERWQRIQELFHAAEACPPERRAALLDEACQGEDELRQQVEALLAASTGVHLEKAVAHAVAGLEAEQAPALPESIGEYRILRRLGEGGMGIVYEAEQIHPRRKVALKVLRSARHASGHARRLFEREAQVLGRLKHPGIATIFESGVAEDGMPFLVMELVSGQPLDEWVNALGPPRSLRQADVEVPLRMFRAICDAVTYAHQNGVIHRDLKPSNILVSDVASSTSETGSGHLPLVKILDFGLARITDQHDGASLYQTETAVVQGSLPYMSPEQARGDSSLIDLRTDIYALGVILYGMLTRQHPFLTGSRDAGGSPRGLIETLRLIETALPRRFSHWTKKYDADLEAIVLKALEKDPSRRYDSVASLAGDLDRYLGSLPILARPPSTFYQVRMLVRRNRMGFAGLVAAACLLVAFSITTAVQARRISAERDRANQEAATAQQVSDFLVDLFRQTNPNETHSEVTARDLLRAGRERVNEELRDQPELRARLLDRIGDAYSVIGPLSEAQSVYEESLRIRTGAFGEGSPASVDSWNGLSVALYNQGEFGKAVEATRRALEITETHQGEGSPKTAGILASLAMNLSGAGDSAGAVAAIGRAVELDKRYGRAGTPSAITRLQNLGAILRQKGDYHEALPHLREAAEAQRRIDDPMDLAVVLNELGMTLNLAGESAEAEKALRECLSIVREKLGEDHGNVSMILINIGYTLGAQGRATEAEAIARQALGVFDRSLGPEHPRRGDILMALGDAQIRQGLVDEARASFSQARSIATEAWGAEHPRAARATVRLGRLEAEQGDPRRALPLLEEGRAALATSAGVPEGAIIERAIGEAYLALGDTAKAEPLITGSLAILRKSLGERHPETRHAERVLARLRRASPGATPDP